MKEQKIHGNEQSEFVSIYESLNLIIIELDEEVSRTKNYISKISNYEHLPSEPNDSKLPTPETVVQHFRLLINRLSDIRTKAIENNSNLKRIV